MKWCRLADPHLLARIRVVEADAASGFRTGTPHLIAQRKRNVNTCAALGCGSPPGCKGGSRTRCLEGMNLARCRFSTLRNSARHRTERKDNGEHRFRGDRFRLLRIFTISRFRCYIQLHFVHFPALCRLFPRAPSGAGDARYAHSCNSF